MNNERKREECVGANLPAGFIERHGLVDPSTVEEEPDSDGDGVCKLCHATMQTRDGCDPTEICDNCAQAFYASHASGGCSWWEQACKSESARLAAESKLSQLQLANEEKARKIEKMVNNSADDFHQRDWWPEIVAILNGGQQ